MTVTVYQCIDDKCMTDTYTIGSGCDFETIDDLKYYLDSAFDFWYIDTDDYDYYSNLPDRANEYRDSSLADFYNDPDNINEDFNEEDFIIKNDKETNGSEINDDDFEIDSDSDEDESRLLDEQSLRLGNPWNHWTDVFKIFNLIADMNKGNKQAINDKVKEFYNMFKGIKVVDTAYNKWTQ